MKDQQFKFKKKEISMKKKEISMKPKKPKKKSIKNPSIEFIKFSDITDIHVRKLPPKEC